MTFKIQTLYALAIRIVYHLLALQEIAASKNSGKMINTIHIQI